MDEILEKKKLWLRQFGIFNYRSLGEKIALKQISF